MVGDGAPWWGFDDKQRAASPTRQSFGVVSAHQCTTSVPRARTRVLHVSIRPLVPSRYTWPPHPSGITIVLARKLGKFSSSRFPSQVSVPCRAERAGSEAGFSEVPGLYRVHELCYGYVGGGKRGDRRWVFFFSFDVPWTRDHRVRTNRAVLTKDWPSRLLTDHVITRCYW